MRAPVPLPQGIQIHQDESAFASVLEPGAPVSVVITRRWLRGKHFILLFIFWSLTAALAWAIHKHGLNFATGFGALVVLNWNYTLLGAFLNRTEVRAGHGAISVKHRPLPTLMARNVHLKAEDIKQLYGAKHGSLFAVKAKLHQGEDKLLVAPLVSEEQALFIEQQLEQAIAIVDFEVPGELAGAMPEMLAKASGKKTGGAAPVFIALMPLVLGGGIFALIYSVFQTEVSGTLNTSLLDPPFEFTPSDCRSGQPYGFMGVDVVSQQGQTVRVLQDPVDGPVVLLREASGRTNLVPLDKCSAVDIDAHHTNTTINDVRVIDGHANLTCPQLTANLTFAGCH